MLNFLKLITQNWIGGVIGIVVAVLLSLILGFTAFKGNKIVSTVITIILVIAFSFAGIFIQNYFFTLRDENNPYYDVINDPTITVVDPDKYLNISSNGGYDRTYIEEVLKTAETTEDKYSTIYMVEYKEIVVYYYDLIVNNQTYTVNIIMNKVNNNLVMDGCINIYTKESGANFIFWDTRKYEYINEMFKGNNFAPLINKLNSSKSPNYYCTVYEPSMEVLYKDTQIGILDLITGISNKARKVAQIGNLGVYNNYFQQLGDLGIMLDVNNIFKQMNNFYSSVYHSTKDSGITNCCLNVTNLCAYYNASEDKFYKANLYLNVNYKDYSSESAFATGVKQNNDNKEQIKDDVDTDVIEFQQSVYTKFILSPSQSNIDMSGFDISSSPVKITLRNNLNSYVLNFDTQNELAYGISQSIMPGKYNITIDSSVLQLGNTAEVEITKNSSIIKFNYDYEYNTILVSVGLNPLSNFDFSDLDLSLNPVTITFNNGISSYTFIWDNVLNISNEIIQRLPMGNYNYSITSEELSFSQSSGELLIDVNNYIFTFNYDYKTNVEFFLKYTEYDNEDVSVGKTLIEVHISQLAKDYITKNLSSVNGAKLLYEDSNGNLQSVNLYFDSTYNWYFNEIDTENLIGSNYYQVVLSLSNGSIVTNVLNLSTDFSKNFIYFTVKLESEKF